MAHVQLSQTSSNNLGKHSEPSLTALAQCSGPPLASPHRHLPTRLLAAPVAFRHRDCCPRSPENGVLSLHVAASSSRRKRKRMAALFWAIPTVAKLSCVAALAGIWSASVFGPRSCAASVDKQASELVHFGTVPVHDREKQDQTLGPDQSLSSCRGWVKHQEGSAGRSSAAGLQSAVIFD